MKRSILISLSLAVFAIGACKKNPAKTATELPPDVPGPAIQIDSFPLHVGNQWVYEVVRANSSITTTAVMTAVSDTLVDSIRLTKLAGDRPQFTLALNDCYYANLDSGMYQFENLSFTGNDLTQKRRNMVLQLPANIGQAWNIFCGTAIGKVMLPSLPRPENLTVFAYPTTAPMVPTISI